MATRIPWCDETWNPMTGCTPVSDGCEHCYAKRLAGRNLPVTACPVCHGKGGSLTWEPPSDPDSQDIRRFETCPECDGAGYFYFEPHFYPIRLGKPLYWKKPRRIFVCSMSDLFHEAFTDHQIGEVLEVMARCPQHTFMLLTKRPERMREYVLRHDGAPLANVWLGVTAENQQRADERIPILLDTPAAVHWVSCEPLLGPVTFSEAGWHDYFDGWDTQEHVSRDEYGDCVLEPQRLSTYRLEWVVVGGETGPGARPMRPEWALDVWRECKAAGVPFFWKSWGANDPWIDPHAEQMHDDKADWSDIIRMENTREYPDETRG